MDLGSLHTGGSVMSDDKAYMSYEEYLENVKKGIVTKDGNCPANSA